MLPPIRAALLLIVVGLSVACGTEAVAQTRSSDTENRRVRVHNQTGAPVRSLSVAEPGGAFTADLLAGEALEAGRSRPLVLDTGTGACQVTVRAVLADGRALDRPNVNVCRIADWYLTR